MAFAKTRLSFFLLCAALTSGRAQNGASAEQPPARWFVHPQVGLLLSPELYGPVAGNVSVAGGYVVDARQSVGLGVRAFGGGRPTRSGGALGLGTRYRLYARPRLLLQAEAGLVLRGTNGTDFSDGTPRGPGGVYGAVHVDYAGPAGLTAGVYGAAAGGYRYDEVTYDWDTGRYEPSGTHTGRCWSAGVSVGWSFPRRRGQMGRERRNRNT